MFPPPRIDHHGWQLAFSRSGSPGSPIPSAARGGATTGLASAASLAIGLEMLIYLALMAAARGPVLGRRPRRAHAARGLCRRACPAAPRSASCCSPPTPIAPRCATRCRRCGWAMRWSAARCWSGWPCCAPSAGRCAWRWRRARACCCCRSMRWPGRIACRGSKGSAPKRPSCGSSHVREARPIYRHGIEDRLLMLSLPIAGLFGWALARLARARRRATCCADARGRRCPRSPRCCCCSGRPAPAPRRR